LVFQKYTLVTSHSRGGHLILKSNLIPVDRTKLSCSSYDLITSYIIKWQQKIPDSPNNSKIKYQNRVKRKNWKLVFQKYTLVTSHSRGGHLSNSIWDRKNLVCTLYIFLRHIHIFWQFLHQVSVTKMTSSAVWSNQCVLLKHQLYFELNEFYKCPIDDMAN
jgi:hypothetical protein